MTQYILTYPLTAAMITCIHPSILPFPQQLFPFCVHLSEPIALSLWLSQATYRRDIWVTKQPCLNFNLAFQHASLTVPYNAVFTLPMCLYSVNRLPRNKEKPIHQSCRFYVVERYYSCLIPADIISVLFYLSVVSLTC